VKLIVHDPQPWPKEYKRYRSRNACVRNATMLAWDYPDDLRVAKGYALQGDDRVRTWVGHWWCVDVNGRVVDPTWKNEGRAYIAIEIVDVPGVPEAWELGLPQIAPPELVPKLESARTVHTPVIPRSGKTFD
jgi:hypothetical protein